MTARQVASVAADSGDTDDVDEIESRLRLVLGDVGIVMENDPALTSIIDQSWPTNTPVGSHDGIIDDAITFIDHLSQTRDLHSYYRKDIQQMEAAVRRLREARR